jgi:hypothetical protein
MESTKNPDLSEPTGIPRTRHINKGFKFNISFEALETLKELLFSKTRQNFRIRSVKKMLLAFIVESVLICMEGIKIGSNF